MGFKSSSLAMAQTTRFKRNLSRNSRSSRNAFSTPPAAPFNNTSFLIHLQQHRQHHHHHHGSGTAAAFDQYGSMQTYMSTIACRSNPSASSSHSTTTSPGWLRAPISGSPSTSQISTPDSEREFSDPDGSHLRGSGPREMNSGGDGGASSVSVRSPKVEGDEGDGVQMHRVCRCFKDDNVGTQCAGRLGSRHGASKEVARSL